MGMNAVSGSSGNSGNNTQHTNLHHPSTPHGGQSQKDKSNSSAPSSHGTATPQTTQAGAHVGATSSQESAHIGSKRLAQADPSRSPYQHVSQQQAAAIADHQSDLAGLTDPRGRQDIRGNAEGTAYGGGDETAVRQAAVRTMANERYSLPGYFSTSNSPSEFDYSSKNQFDPSKVADEALKNNGITTQSGNQFNGYTQQLYYEGATKDELANDVTQYAAQHPNVGATSTSDSAASNQSSLAADSIDSQGTTFQYRLKNLVDTSGSVDAGILKGNMAADPLYSILDSNQKQAASQQATKYLQDIYNNSVANGSTQEQARDAANSRQVEAVTNSVTGQIPPLYRGAADNNFHDSIFNPSYGGQSGWRAHANAEARQYLSESQGTGLYGQGAVYQTVDQPHQMNPMVPIDQPQYNGSLPNVLNGNGAIFQTGANGPNYDPASQINRNALNSAIQQDPIYNVLPPEDQKKVQQSVYSDIQQLLNDGASPYNTQVNLPWIIRNEVDTHDSTVDLHWKLTQQRDQDVYWGEAQGLLSGLGRQPFDNIPPNPDMPADAARKHVGPGYIEGIWLNENQFTVGNNIIFEQDHGSADIGGVSPPKGSLTWDWSKASSVLNDNPFWFDRQAENAVKNYMENEAMVDKNISPELRDIIKNNMPSSYGAMMKYLEEGQQNIQQYASTNTAELEAMATEFYRNQWAQLTQEEAATAATEASALEALEKSI
jgi:hypothetical protein